jgi:hypothetical protein
MKLPADVTNGIIKSFFVEKLEVIPGKPTRSSRDIFMYCGLCFWKEARNAPHVTFHVL